MVDRNAARQGSLPTLLIAGLTGVALFILTWVLASSAFRYTVEPGQLEAGLLTVNGVDPAVGKPTVDFDKPFVIRGNPARDRPPYLFGANHGEVFILGAEFGHSLHDALRPEGISPSFDDLGPTRHLIGGEVSLRIFLGYGLTQEDADAFTDTDSAPPQPEDNFEVAFPVQVDGLGFSSAPLVLALVFGAISLIELGSWCWRSYNRGAVKAYNPFSLAITSLLAGSTTAAAAWALGADQPGPAAFLVPGATFAAAAIALSITAGHAGRLQLLGAPRDVATSSADLSGLERRLDDLTASMARSKTDLSQDAAPDGTVTLMFTDIVDSTILANRLGDRRWADVLGRHRELVREALGSEGGRVVDTAGDGFLVAFPSARRALRCATAIQRLTAEDADGVEVRIGLHTGEAIRDAEAFIGRHVHLAARVASQAGGGEILISNVTRELVAGDDFTFGESYDVELKGFEGRRTLVEVRWDGSRPPR